MTFISWRAEFSLGIPSADAEHKELIELLNEIHDELLRSGAGDSDVHEFLGELYAKISAHFALEEKLMREHSYDGYEDHKADHERLLDEIRDLMDEFEDSNVLDAEAFGKKLEAWFSNHFRTMDARLHHRLG
jgi:hemerythrin-like metal-binding protein